MWTTLGASRLNLESNQRQVSAKFDHDRRTANRVCIPDRGALSSNSFPNEISRMELGDDGRDSQSACN